MYDVTIRYEDGRRSKVRDQIDDLGEACAYVLQLAEELGNAAGDGGDLAKWVEIFLDERLEISVSVIHGGLTVGGGARKYRAG